MAKVLDKVLKFKYSIGGKQLDNWLQLEMGFKPCLEWLTEVEEITVGILTEGSTCDSQIWVTWEMKQGQERKEWIVSQIDLKKDRLIWFNSILISCIRIGDYCFSLVVRPVYIFAEWGPFKGWNIFHLCSHVFTSWGFSRKILVQVLTCCHTLIPFIQYKGGARQRLRGSKIPLPHELKKAQRWRQAPPQIYYWWPS